MSQGNGIGGHQSHRMKNDEWLTPKEIIEALGPFDTDPCAPIVRPWDTAKLHYTVNDDGLNKPWFGNVWLNPPYGSHVGRWMNRLRTHGTGIALVFARVETEWWFSEIWDFADAVFFPKGRLTFCYVNGQKADNNSGAPSAFVAFGRANADRLKNWNLNGKFLPLYDLKDERIQKTD